MPDNTLIFDSLCHGYSDTDDYKFKQNYGGDLHLVSWNYLFLEYIKRLQRMSEIDSSKKNPNMSLEKTISKLDTHLIWQDDFMQDMQRRGCGFIEMEKNHKIADLRDTAHNRKNKNFIYRNKYEDFYISYTEDFFVPGHANLFMHIKDYYVARDTSDFLYIDENKNTLSVKFIHKDHSVKQAAINHILATDKYSSFLKRSR